MSSAILRPNSSFLVGISASTLTHPPVRARASNSFQQHGLADPAQTGDQHRLLRVPACQAGEQHVEGLELGIPPDQRRRASAGVGGVGVEPGIHYSQY